MKFVIFDLFGTIIKEGYPVRKDLLKLLEKEIGKEIKFEDFEDYYILYITGRFTIEKFLEKFNIESNKINSIKEKFFNLFHLDENFKEIYDYLKQNKYVIVLLSNAPKDLWEFLENKFELNGKFYTTIMSYDWKYMKPDTMIYMAAIKYVGIESEVAMIDDQLENLETAFQFNWKTIWIKREEQESEFKPDFIINSLNELKNIL